MCYQNMLLCRMEGGSHVDMTVGGCSRGQGRRGKSRNHKETTLDDSSSSS